MTKYLRVLIVSLLHLLATSHAAQAQDFNGAFVVSGPESDIQVVFEQAISGLVSGVMSDGFTVMQLDGAPNASGIGGSVITDVGEELGFVAQLQADNSLYLTLRISIRRLS